MRWTDLFGAARRPRHGRGDLPPRRPLHPQLPRLLRRDSTPLSPASRVERAMFLLRETERSVTDVCLDVGFTTLGTFSRTFRPSASTAKTEISTSWVSRGIAHAVRASAPPIAYSS